ncbi:MAG: TonB-dependent receptor [Porticoccaceae bacterium]|nr:TonB-dependent receptor [Porticoccaceae bacterium]
MPTAVVLAATSFALDFGFIPQALAETSDLSLTAQSVQNSQTKAPTLAFNISPQPLESGLVAFSKQADINIIGVTAILRDHRVAVLKGDFTKAEALDRLLEGTGLSYEMINDTAVSIFVKPQVPETLDEEPFLQEIFITATGRATDLQKTPIAVSAFDQVRLDFAGATDLRALSHMVPGLEMTNTAPQAATLVQLRGVGSTNITEIADGPVSIHVDGIYSPRSQAAVALLYDVDRIEVLRGPQGTLRGRNSPSGSINVYNQQPLLDVLEGNISLGYGNYDRREYHGALNLPVSDTLSVRFAGASLRHDAYTELVDNYLGLGSGYPTNSTELSAFDQAVDYGQDGPEMADKHSWRVSALWQPTEEFRAVTSLERYRDQGTGLAQLAPDLVAKGIRAVVSDSPSFLDLTNTALRTELDYKTDNYSLRYLYGQSQMRRQQIVDADNGRSSSFEQQRTHSSDFTFSSHELQLMNDDTERLRWLLGAFFSREKNEIVFAVDQQNAGGGRFANGATSWINDFDGAAVSYAIQPDRQVESMGLFSQVTYDLDELSSLTVGARYTKDSKSDRDGRAINCRVTSALGSYVGADSIGPGAPSPEDIYADTATQQAINAGTFHDNGTSEGIGDQPCWIRQVNDLNISWENVSGLIRYDYRPSDDLMYFASLSNGFKSGHIQDAGNHVAPETVTNFELGFKAQYLDDSLRLNGALFHADYRDLQFSNEDRLDINFDGIADTGGSTVVRNASAATIQGLELELDWVMTDVDQLQLTAAFTHAHFDQFEIPDTLFGDLFNPYVSDQSLSPEDPVVLSGNSPPRVPDWKLTLSYSHNFIFDRGVLTPRVVLKASDSYFLDIYNRDKLAPGIFDSLPNGGESLGVQQSYKLFDLSLAYQPNSKNWTVAAYIHNLADKNIKVDSGNVLTSAGLIATYMEPRTFQIKFNYSFSGS